MPTRGKDATGWSQLLPAAKIMPGREQGAGPSRPPLSVWRSHRSISHFSSLDETLVGLRLDSSDVGGGEGGRDLHIQLVNKLSSLSPREIQAQAYLQASGSRPGSVFPNLF